MDYNSITNLYWSDSDQTMIDCTVDFIGLGSVPFTASPIDKEPHGKKIWNEINNGDYGSIGDFIPIDSA